MSAQAIMSCCIYAKEKQTGNESEEVDVEELQLMNRYVASDEPRIVHVNE
jgi:hypothetical protein